VIFYIDEDVFQNKPFRVALEFRGHIVKPIDNADEGLLAILSMTRNDSAIIDVMLGTGDSTDSQFDRASTQNFMRTGVILAERAVHALGAQIAHSLLFFTNAGNTSELWAYVDENAKRLGIPVLQKGAYGSPRAFIEKLITIGFFGDL
jgi:hypothetical protein